MNGDEPNPTHIMINGTTPPNMTLKPTISFAGAKYIQFYLSGITPQADPIYLNGSVNMGIVTVLFTWEMYIACPPPPPLIINLFSGPFVRNRVEPVLAQQPDKSDVFQSIVEVNDTLNGMYGNYLCSSKGYICSSVPMRQTKHQTILLQMSIYPLPIIAGSENFTEPINITVTNTGRTTYVIFPPLVTNTTVKTRAMVIFDYTRPTGVVPSRVNPNYAALINSNSPEAIYFVYPNVSFTNDLLFYPKAIKPAMTLPNGDTLNLILAGIEYQAIRLYEALDNARNINNVTLSVPPYVIPTSALLAQTTPWANGIQFRTTFVLPSYRKCSYNYGPQLPTNDNSFAFPFGVQRVASGGNVSMSFTFYINGYEAVGTILSLDCYFGDIRLSTPGPINQTDKGAPVIISFEIGQIGGNMFLLRAHITDDLSGFARLFVYFASGELLDINYLDLYSGTSQDGYYEKLFILNNQTVTTPKYSIFIIDFADNVDQIDTYSNSLSGTPSTMYTASYIIGAEDLTVFYFDQYVMDVSNTSLKNKVYLRSPKIKKDSRVSINFGSIDENPNYEAIGKYDIGLDMFVIEFTIPVRTMTRQLQYYIIINPFWNNLLKKYVASLPSTIDSYVIYHDLLIKQFPNTSIINIISKNGDEMPPMITKIAAYPSTAPVMTVAGQMEIGWNFIIEDLLNGFDHGVMNVISDLDGLERTFTFTSDDRLSGTPQGGWYQIRFNVSSDMGNQTFTFLNIELFDTGMNRAYYHTDTQYLTTVSPIAYVLFNGTMTNELNMKLTTSSQDFTEPTVWTVSVTTPYVDVGSHQRLVTIYFTVREAGGMSPRHTPYVYLTGYMFELFQIQAEQLNRSGDLYTYMASAQLPYAYGSTSCRLSNDTATTSYLFVSIYGLVDVAQNTRGYSTEELFYNGMVDRVVQVQYNHLTPIIETYMMSPVDDSVVTLIGKNFGSDCVMLETSGRTNVTIRFVKLSSSVVYAVYRIKVISDNPLTSPLLLTVQIKNQPEYYSNTVPITFNPPPVIPTVKCPGTPPCSNNGECSTTFGCQCYGTWYGDDCSSQAVPNVPVINPDTPTTVYTFNTSGMTIVGEIEIVRVRVLDQLGAELASYPLGQWNTTITSNQSYDYLSMFGSDVDNMGMIKVNVRWFTDDYNISFAGDILPMKKNTIKYTITLSNYAFPSKLDSMQVVMRATINTTDANSCSAEQYGYTEGADGNKDNLFWMRVKVQSYSVYGHFIQKAMVDGRVSAVSNVLLNDTVQTVNDTQSSQTLIGINVQSFTQQAVMDPDFQLLLDTDDASTVDGAVCSKGGKGRSKLSTLAIVGIVVLSVVIVAAIAVGVAMRMRVVRRERHEVNRINMKMNRLSESVESNNNSNLKTSKSSLITN
ncbi:hypothetical protein SAMD00019534_116460 [Acytostelium subglobosum LB1]|uniref:hypothetical protein n=1 Tax=Acytostelium subglobosum LB1 TaxID=1410327 RepID=UPI0006449181|nr:hypothetical protein SAMD00019534_116460 [Acytostelium subglobosum LB1]GAM28470.1 hypothetical protein SAMD00019534_116460 [Acytostelium subglobosum LB1]|eukprot:XP_012748509.1 hypothetical protein SAMD00019534_116460 [Acytostelium subglobosum LB1]